MGARLVIAAACCAGLVLAPAAAARRPTGAATAKPTGAALTITPAAHDSSPVALIADPARPGAGQLVRLSLVHPPSDAGGFAWDLTGRGVYGRDTRATAYIEARFTAPGAHAVAVRFTASGHTRVAVLTVHVAGRAVRAPRPRAAHPRRAESAGLTGRVTAHTAGDPGVTVADFHFSPASTTIYVGDTITWTNHGPSSHTATARNGGFDTGVLKKGQSASHTFTQAGTFTYFCQIHPFMHGTIVVRAASTSTSGANTTASGATTSTPSATTPTATTAADPTPAQAGPTLPNTGFNLATGLAAGLLLLGAGAALRRVRQR